MQAINETLEKKESQLSEVCTCHYSVHFFFRRGEVCSWLCSQVIHAANLDPNMLGAVSRKLDDVLDAKNGAIKVRDPASHASPFRTAAVAYPVASSRLYPTSHLPAAGLAIRAGAYYQGSQ